MQVDPCGCVGEGQDVAWCPDHRAFHEKAMGLAVRISAQRACTVEKAWGLIWDRLISIDLIRFMRKAGAELVKS